jgi:hypothetical protein
MPERIEHKGWHRAIAVLYQNNVEELRTGLHIILHFIYYGNI